MTNFNTNSNVNSDELIYEMMIVSLEDKIKELKKIMETQNNLVQKIMTKFVDSSNELSKYKEKYGEL